MNWSRISLIVVLCGLILSCESPAEKPVENVQKVTYGSGYDSLSAVIGENSNDPFLYRARAMWLLDNEEFIKAHGDMDRAITLDSSNGEFYVNKAEIFIAQKKIGQAKLLLDDAIYWAPGSTEIMLKTSEIYLWAGDYQKTIDWANTALKFDQYLAQAYYLKGMAHEYSKDTVNAVNSFQTAIEQDPAHYDSYMQLGKLYAIAGHELADAYLTNALNVDTASIETLYARGLFRQEQQRSKDAISDYEKILELEPKHVAAHYNIGYVRLIQLEQVDSALIYFQKAASNAPEYADAFYMWGYCLELQSKYPEALAMYRNTLNIDDQHSLAAMGVNRLE